MSSAASRYGEPHPAMSIAITAEITKAISAKIKNITAEGVSNSASLPQTTTVRPKIRVRSDPLVVRMWTCQPGQIDACLTPAYQMASVMQAFDDFALILSEAMPDQRSAIFSAFCFAV